MDLESGQILVLTALRPLSLWRIRRQVIRHERNVELVRIPVRRMNRHMLVVGARHSQNRVLMRRGIHGRLNRLIAGRGAIRIDELRSREGLRRATHKESYGESTMISVLSGGLSGRSQVWATFP